MALTPFLHRYAMVALACADHATFVPSVAEAEMDGATPRVFYTIDTVRRFRREHPDDHLYFIVGADQFLELPTWKSYEALLDSCDFIIASRPGFKLDALRLVIPPEKLGPRMRENAPDPQQDSAAQIGDLYAHDRVEPRIFHRNPQPARRRKNIHGLVPPRVEEYILGQALYR